MPTFGERFKMLRNEKRLTQDKLADKFFLNKSSISRYENNGQIPEMDLLEKFADFFNVSVDFLLGRTDNRGIDINRKISEIESIPQFEDAEDAFKFILEQPQVAAYGGYDLKNMSEEEILEIANDMLFAMKLSIEKMKRKK